MRAFFEGFILSISFFTKLPTPYHVKNITQNTYKFLTLTIPLNGIILGTLTIVLFHLLSPFADERYVAFLSCLTYLFMYGFLHLEAVADIIDAYYAKHGGKDAYVVLKDSHVGALGAIGTFSLMIAKVVALSYLLVKQNYLGILAILFISRLMVVGVIYLYEFHEESKFIYNLKKPLTQNNIIVLLLLSIIILLLLNHPLLLTLSIPLTYTTIKWLIQNIGFLNGDGLGFIIELNELLLLNVLIFI